MKRFPRFLLVILMVSFFFSLAGCHPSMCGGKKGPGSAHGYLGSGENPTTKYMNDTKQTVVR